MNEVTNTSSPRCQYHLQSSSGAEARECVSKQFPILPIPNTHHVNSQRSHWDFNSKQHMSTNDHCGANYAAASAWRGRIHTAPLSKPPSPSPMAPTATSVTPSLLTSPTLATE
eukprot:m.95619 g.95619  ORF g.95619 m.95619 type:complete len:113 (+) comp16608_c0_seq3:2474-2812(+)